MKYQQTPSPNKNRFVIGTTKDSQGRTKTMWTDTAIDQELGTLTNDDLMKKSDFDLQIIANTPRGIRTENYRAPYDPEEAKKQGHESGEIYQGVHRAVLILEFRRLFQVNKESLDTWKPKQQELLSS